MRRDLFEEWYNVRFHKLHAVWHPEENRYTVMTKKQAMWEAWCGGFKKATDLVAERVQRNHKETMR
jgi:hypothetical protein